MTKLRWRTQAFKVEGYRFDSSPERRVHCKKTILCSTFMNNGASGKFRILCGIMILTLLCVTGGTIVHGQTTGTISGGLVWSVNADGTSAGIIGYSGTGGTITIPSTVSVSGSSLPVTSIGLAAFLNCKSLTSVTIPFGVTSIAGSAFSGCTGLTTVTIPSSVTSIGESAFQSCAGLTSLSIPSNVTSIADSAFCSCDGLTSVTIPSRVTSIGDFAFDGCMKLAQ